LTIGDCAIDDLSLIDRFWGLRHSIWALGDWIIVALNQWPLMNRTIE
jgi:hypothetical protein